MNILSKIQDIRARGIFCLGDTFIVTDNIDTFKELCPDKRRWFITLTKTRFEPFYVANSDCGNDTVSCCIYDKSELGDINYFIKEEN